jgi:hypothetical protein
VQSVHTKEHGVVTSTSEDPFVGATVSFPLGAVMVALDPEGTLATQIFCDGIHVSVGAGMGLQIGPMRFFCRNVGRRNLNARGFSSAAASWFAAIPHDQLSIDKGRSPVLSTFGEAHDQGFGIQVAFCTYFLRPRFSQTRLAADFASGLSTRNPAIGRWIGTISVWDPAEMRTATTGRRLFPSADLQHDHQQFRLNTALTTVQSDRLEVTIDLTSTFPEVDETLAKVNVGEVRLGAVTSSGGGERMVDIGEVRYDRSTYERQSGLVDVPYTADKQAAIDSGNLVLYLKDSGTRVLTERRWDACSDDRCVYLQEGESRELTFRVFDKGVMSMNEVEVRVVQYDMTNRVMTPVAPGAGIVGHVEDLPVPAGGQITFEIVAQRPGVCVLAILPQGEDDQSLEFLVNIRVFPLDDYSAVPESAVTFDFIYNEVLRYYHLLYPAMSERFSLDNEFRVRLKAAEIKKRISATLFASVAYMPITRDLSDGKRNLLERWCNLAIGGEDPVV